MYTNYKYFDDLERAKLISSEGNQAINISHNTGPYKSVAYPESSKIYPRGQRS